MAELTFVLKILQITLSWAVLYFGGKDLNKGLTVMNCTKSAKNTEVNFTKDKNEVLHFEKKT